MNVPGVLTTSNSTGNARSSTPRALRVLEPTTILSFDVEEHHRIEAAVGCAIDADRKHHYLERVEPVTRWILEFLAARGIRATFFVVGELARARPSLVRAIHAGGHEVASHGWDHRRVLVMSPAEFRADLRASVDILQQTIGSPIFGYRAPTFSITRTNPWAIDIIGEEGIQYDSSVYPVRHDRYGVPGAPRSPFMVRGATHSILELPPLTLGFGRAVMPVGGGGYFRLFPRGLIRQGLRQAQSALHPPVAMLYFHPWEFDDAQPRLPLKGVRGWRTYVGIDRARERLAQLIKPTRYETAFEIARRIRDQEIPLPQFRLGR
jgi:polysaccharide deacetylase family protein (PEP-CTERM system associated)